MQLGLMLALPIRQFPCRPILNRWIRDANTYMHIGSHYHAWAIEQKRWRLHPWANAIAQGREHSERPAGAEG